MKIILDVNVLLSALIKNSTTREIIVKSGQDFCFPESSLIKIRKYKDLILKKSGLSEKEFLVVLHSLLKFVRIIPLEEISNNLSEAKEIMEHIDPEDVIFIATALNYRDVVIWSDDKHFDKQDSIIVLKSDQMVNLFKDSNKE